MNPNTRGVICFIRSTRYLAVLLPLFAVGIAWAFEPGPEIIRECSKCKAPLVQETTASGNTYDARVWTDGKMLAAMLPERPRLVKCPKCGTLLWIDEVKELGRQTFGPNSWDKEKEKRWPKAMEPNLPTEADFLSVLSAGKLPREKERYARCRAWWAANDVVRTKKRATMSFSPAEQANLHALANLLDEKDPDLRITKAEIFREVKKFDDCVKLLTQPFDEKWQAERATFIKKLAEQKVRAVREIEYKKPNQPEAGDGK